MRSDFFKKILLEQKIPGKIKLGRGDIEIFHHQYREVLLVVLRIFLRELITTESSGM